MQVLRDTTRTGNKTSRLSQWFTTLLVTIVALFVSGISFSQTFNSSTTYTVPPGVTTLTFNAWGAGGGGGAAVTPCDSVL